jgi:hypothetical protein
MSSAYAMAQADLSSIWVAVAEEGGPYAQVAKVMQAELPAAQITIASLDKLLTDSVAPPALVVTVGAMAFEGAIKRLSERETRWATVPVLATFLPRASFETYRKYAARRPVSALVLDQPVDRQLKLIQRAFPDRNRIGILFGPQSKSLREELLRQSNAYGLQLVSAAAESSYDIYPALRSILSDTDVILALPDPLVYNAATLQHILLTTYRARVPLAAFSPGQVQAGAAIAVHSTPEQIGRQTAEIIRQWLPGRKLPGVQSPREFAISVNQKVVASLGLQINHEPSLAEGISRRQ